jgi:hypothetical protein
MLRSLTDAPKKFFGHTSFKRLSLHFATARPGFEAFLQRSSKHQKDRSEEL